MPSSADEADASDEDEAVIFDGGGFRARRRDERTVVGEEIEHNKYIFSVQVQVCAAVAARRTGRRLRAQTAGSCLEGGCGHAWRDAEGPRAWRKRARCHKTPGVTPG